MSLPRNKKLKDNKLSNQLHEISVQLRNNKLQDIKNLQRDADRLYGQGIDEKDDYSHALILLTEAIAKRSQIPEIKRDNNDLRALCKYHLALAMINFSNMQNLDKLEHEYIQAKMYYDKIIMPVPSDDLGEKIQRVYDDLLWLKLVATNLCINYYKQLNQNQELRKANKELLDSLNSKHHHHHHKNKTAAKSGDSALVQNTIFANANVDAKTTDAPAADTQSMNSAKI